MSGDPQDFLFGGPWIPGFGTWSHTHQVTYPTVPDAPYGPAHTHYHFTPQRLSDEDVERIAKRVADLLREPAAEREHA